MLAHTADRITKPARGTPHPSINDLTEEELSLQTNSVLIMREYFNVYSSSAHETSSEVESIITLPMLGWRSLGGIAVSLPVSRPSEAQL